MTSRPFVAPGPGLVSRQLPREAVMVHDATLQHATFRTPRRGIRVGVHMCGDIVWTICIELDGRQWGVPPAWVRDAAGDAMTIEAQGATVIPFPAGGRRRAIPQLDAR